MEVYRTTRLAYRSNRIEEAVLYESSPQAVLVTFPAPSVAAAYGSPAKADLVTNLGEFAVWQIFGVTTVHWHSNS